jgi:iron complex transport system substrate-binding protein
LGLSLIVLRARPLVALLTVFAIILAGCGDDDDDGNGNGAGGGSAVAPAPSRTVSPGAGTVPTEAPTPAPTVASPVAVIDDLGREVELPAAPERIVAMSPSVVELLFAVGATPVGRPDSADFPAAADEVATFGSAYQPSLEEIAAFEPDLIIADALIQGATIEDFTGLGAPVYALRVGSFADVTRGLRFVGELTGNAAAGESAAAALENQLASILDDVPEGDGPSVLVVVGAGPDQIFAAKNDSYVGDLITTLGGRNVITTEPDTFRLPGFTEYSLERIVEHDPDVILALSPGGPPGSPLTSEALAQTPVWSGLRAVQEGRVTELDPVIYLQAAGPRVSQILDELSRILYPDVF